MTGVKPTDRVIIAGQENFDLMLGLCRKGFRTVSCRTAHGGPFDGVTPADILWIPGAATDDQVATAVARLSRDLRPDGLVVIDDQTPERARRLVGLLVARGFVVECQPRDMEAHGRLLCARKLAAAPLRRAA